LLIANCGRLASRPSAINIQQFIHQQLMFAQKPAITSLTIDN